MVEKNQPFIKKNFFKSDLYTVYRDVDLKIVNEITQNNLKMADCSRVLSISEPETNPVYYIDPTHYSPSGNKVLASCIYEKISHLKG